MGPIEKRITAARLMALRAEPQGREAIVQLLGVGEMPPALAVRAESEIDRFMETGDATLAAQLIHAALVRRTRAQDGTAA